MLKLFLGLYCKFFPFTSICSVSIGIILSNIFSHIHTRTHAKKQNKKQHQKPSKTKKGKDKKCIENIKRFNK